MFHEIRLFEPQHDDRNEFWVRLSSAALDFRFMPIRLKEGNISGIATQVGRVSIAKLKTYPLLSNQPRWKLYKKD